MIEVEQSSRKTQDQKSRNESFKYCNFIVLKLRQIDEVYEP